MKQFNQDYIDFFTELAFNNEKSWFDKNRKRYEQSVREPFKEFTKALINEIAKFNPAIEGLAPNNVMFRINRDIRFSKDKTPYNTWLSAAIVPGGKKASDTAPGYYFRFAVDKVSIGGGLFGPSKPVLFAVRAKLAADSAPLHAALKAKEFKDTWGELGGEENKIIPKEFKQAATKELLIRKKSFMYWQELPEQTILRPDLLEWMTSSFKAAQHVNNYLNVGPS